VIFEWLRNWKESRDHREIENAVYKYITPEGIEKIIANRDGPFHLENETRVLTVMSCGIQNFTLISERLQDDSHILSSFINEYLAKMLAPVVNHEGTIDNFLGDRIWAFWNAPLDDKRHASNACQTALEMCAALKQLNQELLSTHSEIKSHLPIVNRIGIDTGTSRVGNFGFEMRFDYTAIGFSVTKSALLEEWSKKYDVDILISEDTREQSSKFATIEVDLVLPNRFAESIRLHALVGDHKILSDRRFEKLLKVHNQMLDAYRNRDWVKASECIKTCREVMHQDWNLSGIYDVFENRIAMFSITPPPPDWTGVHVIEP